MGVTQDGHLRPGPGIRATARGGAPRPVRAFLREAQGLGAAAAFLTVLPLFRRPLTPEVLGRSVAYFPLVGTALGLALGAAASLLGGRISPLLGAVLVMGAWVTLTGALHLDGLMDTFDGLFGGKSREERLAIMRDPHVGAFGIAAAIFVLLIKVVALSSLEGPALAMALVTTGALSYGAMALAIGLFPYARPEGTGHAFKTGASVGRVAVAAIFSLGGALLLGIQGLWVAIAVGLLVLAAGWLLGKLLGGFTGDGYGALAEVSQALVLVLLSVKAPLHL